VVGDVRVGDVEQVDDEVGDDDLFEGGLEGLDEAVGRRRMKPTVSVASRVRPSGSRNWRVVGSSVAKSLSTARTWAPVSLLRREDLPALV
jgi:hypothetical protein